MKRRMHRLAALLPIALFASAVWASPVGSFKTWSAGEVLTAADLNANFTTVKSAIDDNAAQLGNKQNRVTGTCAAGAVISAVNADGSVVCAAGGGTVSSVAAGSGLTGGTITSSGTLAVAFGGSGSATTAARSDHSHLLRTLYVRPVIAGGVVDAAASGAALLSRVAQVTASGPDNPYLLKLEPGTYDVGATVIPLGPYTSIEGSGRGSSIVKGKIEFQYAAQTVNAVRYLTIRCDPGLGGSQQGILASSASFAAELEVEQVAIQDCSVGIRHSNGSLRVDNVTITGGGYVSMEGISSNSDTFINNARIDIAPTSGGAGVHVDEGTGGLMLQNTQIRLAAGLGIDVRTDATIYNTHVALPSGLSTAALLTIISSGSQVVTVQNSSLSAWIALAPDNSGVTMRVANSLVDGIVDPQNSTIECAFTHNALMVALDATCQ